MILLKWNNANWRLLRMVFAVLALWAAALVPPLHAAGPVEVSVFAVQGVAVDVTDKDAASAKNKALVEVQMKAIVQLAQKLGNEETATEIAKLPEKDVLPLLKSLSIEEESTAPGRYIGKFTVRFQPSKIEALLGRYGVRVPRDQAEAVLLLPVWKDGTGKSVLWGDNIWAKAWADQHFTQDQVPIILPLGDAEDTTALTADDVGKLDPVKLEALKRRYEVKTLLVATAEPVEGGGVHATMAGTSALGKITFDKTYTADDGTLASSVALAAQRFHGVMVDKYRSDKAKLVAQQQAEGEGHGRTVAVSVPFGSPSEWNGLRARILSAPGIVGVDVESLQPQGAVIRVTYSGSLEALQSSIMNTGLTLNEGGAGWTIQPM